MSAVRGDTHRPGLYLFAPSGLIDPDRFNAGVERLRTKFDVTIDPGVFTRRGFMAGTDDERLAAFERALAHPTARFMVAARGGVGATRLLPRIDIDAVRAAGKVLVGFSDITALHSLWRLAGLPSLHASVVTGVGAATDAHFHAWCDAIAGHPIPAYDNLTPIIPGDAEGPLTGGNLAVLTALAGTPHALRARDHIVILEDHAERPFRMDRMLTQLLSSGAFDGARAFVLGEFKNCDAGPDGTTALDVLTERLSSIGVPIYANAPFGHGDTNLPLPLGLPAQLSSRDHALLVTPLVGR